MKRLNAMKAATLLALALASTTFAADVKVWEEQVTIPTYLIGPPDPNPQFYFGGQSQGAQHRIYPYPLYDNLTTEKVDKAYKMVYLENEYVKIGVLPESGGKIFEAIDKTNGYNFFYRQHVIKPALISLLGAWISGGVEWDIPHHHRATSFLPVQYTIEQAADGSKTVWVGELELRDRMRWAVGLTLHPGKSYLEANFRMVNRNPVPTTMLSFSNVAVSVNDSYQVIFPPSTQHVTYHAKRDFTTWPIATTVFNGADFTAGVDVSWYKNHVNAMSMFAWNYQDDFFAGYDHGKNAGTMSIADHNVVPGKKFWTWGTGPRGKMQDTLLTDSDGPYIELMVGAYSDNQPDYTWLEPYETRHWTQYWYPFSGIDGVKNANTEAAVNLEVKDGKVRVGFFSTSDRPTAKASLKLKDIDIIDEEIAISPGKPYVKEVPMLSGADVHDLRAALTVDGKELVAYSPIKLQPEAMPANVTPPAGPADIKTNEELYLTGLRIEQFRTPNQTPEPYWLEALKRDPGDVRVNTALGIYYYKEARCADAEKLLRTALERPTAKYTSPKDGEPFYYLGLALKAQDKIDDAFNQFSKATWAAAWRGPGYFEMAQIASLRGDIDGALAYVHNSLNAGADNTRALGLRSTLLRREGRNEEALAAAERLLEIDPLDIQGISDAAVAYLGVDQEKFRIKRENLLQTMHAFPNTILELAADYMNAGLYDDALTFMRVVTNEGKETSPLMYYYMGYFAQKLHRPDAAEYFATAEKMPTDYAFPFQREMIPVLQAAMAANPKDSRAPYYLGNLLYDWQPERAVALWEKSAAMGADFPVVYRNLAVVYTRQGNARDKALANLEKALQFGGNAMVLNDLDKLYEENGVSPEKRLAIFQQHKDMVNRDDVIAREVNLDIFAGKYDEAIALIKARFFRAWEGGGRFSLGDSWVNAWLLKGQQQLAAKQYKEALADFQNALTFPESLIEATGTGPARKGEVTYWIGVAQDAMGDKEKARQSWQEVAGAEAAAPDAGGRGFGRGGRGGRGGGGGGARGGTGGLGAGVHVDQAATYYQALALEKLGQADKAKVLLQQLANSGTQGAAAGDANASAESLAQRTRTADAHYVRGLGQLGLNEPAKAKEEFTAALKISPDHLGAKVALQQAGQ